MSTGNEHVMEAPYLVTDTNRKGWGVACACGFRSPLFDTREEAQAAATDHLEMADEAVEEPKGFMARRRAKKQQRPDWMERRRS
ncbi:MAG: hypothetical protein JO075_12710 [Acidimicrobiia bacterium]|nr:hypothetical protein [Acidimicrobiia bacterium]